MYLMRESWTDVRLDEFAKNVDRRFDQVDHELHRINDRLDAMNKVLIQAIVTMFGSTLLGFLALASLILTQH